MLSWEPVGFMFFSTIEGVGIFTMMMSFFRLKATDYLWQALFIVLMMNLQSYVMRNDFSLAYLVPIINIFLLVLLLVTVVKISLIWATIITISGYLAFAFIQMLLVITVFGSIENATSTLFNGYSVQTMSGMLSIALAWFLYKFGIGFMFDFERLRLRWEGTLVVLLIVLALFLFSFIVYKNEVKLYFVFLPVALFFLLYYAIRKEKMND